MPRSACLLRPLVGDEVYGRSSGLRAARNATSKARGRPAWTGPDLTLLSPAHRAVHVRARTAGRRRRPRHGQSQRSRSPPPPPPGHHPRDRRTSTRPRLVTMAATTSSPRPIPPLPGTTHVGLTSGIQRPGAKLATRASGNSAGDERADRKGMCGRGYLDVPAALSHRMQSRHQARSPPPVTLGFCGSNPQVMPDVVLVVCNTNDITGRNLIWAGWGKPTATAKGSATVDLCAYEDCISGEYTSVPIEMTASKIMHCSKNTRAYSTLRYLFPDGSPFQDVPTTVKTSGTRPACPTRGPNSEPHLLTS